MQYLPYLVTSAPLYTKSRRSNYRQKNIEEYFRLYKSNSTKSIKICLLFTKMAHFSTTEKAKQKVNGTENRDKNKKALAMEFCALQRYKIRKRRRILVHFSTAPIAHVQ